MPLFFLTHLSILSIYQIFPVENLLYLRAGGVDACTRAIYIILFVGAKRLPYRCANINAKEGGDEKIKKISIMADKHLRH